MTKYSEERIQEIIAHGRKNQRTAESNSELVSERAHKSIWWNWLD